MSDLSRREVVGALAAAAGAFVVPRPAEAQAVFNSMVIAIAGQGGAFAPRIYSAHEWATVRMLVDYIIPKDASSGSATDAQVPEFMDTMLDLEPNMRTAHRGGLAWLDHQGHVRSGRNFIDLTDGDRRAILDDIAYPRKATPDMAMGVSWFNSFRDLTATGFFTSEMGVKDLGYQGNTAVAEWTGCPPENYTRLGVVKPG